MQAPIPDDEQQRLRKLRSLEILDTFPEQAYDDIVFLASEIADTPIALMTLVDLDRQWFKSKVGLDAAETHRDHAFCAHAIRKPNEILVVENAPNDPRFADNPLVTGAPSIRFYAGAPLVCSDGTALGTLCVIDRKPRTLSPLQERALQVLSRQVVAQIELREALNHVKTLRGLFPICSGCKRIRDDEGYWNQIEIYVAKHSEAEFSHSICPTCVERLYPNEAAHMRKRLEQTDL